MLIAFVLVATIILGGAALVWLVLKKGFQWVPPQTAPPASESIQLETPQEFLDETHGTAPNIIITGALPEYADTHDTAFEDKAQKRRKAVVCALDRYADGETLSGCDRDGANMTRRFLERWEVPASDIERILEHYWNQQDAFLRIRWKDSELRVLRNASATCARATRAMQWATTNLDPLGKAWWAQSSHGTQTPSTTEPDGFDETWVMFDCSEKPETWFTDNIIAVNRKRLQQGQSLKIIADSCHSDEMLREYVNGNGRGIVRYKKPPVEIIGARQKKHSRLTGIPETIENAVLLSGCTADSVSYTQKYMVDGRAIFEGALTHELLRVEAAAQTLTLRQVHSAVFTVLAHGKNKQSPQLSGAEYLMDEPFFS